MCNRNTVEFLGIWETLHNPNFNPIEFEEFRKEAGLPKSVEVVYITFQWNTHLF